MILVQSWIQDFEETLFSIWSLLKENNISSITYTVYTSPTSDIYVNNQKYKISIDHQSMININTILTDHSSTISLVVNGFFLGIYVYVL